MNKELKFDHFKNIEELLQHIDIWYKEDDIDYTRWFGLNDLYTLSNYIINLQQENKQLKECYCNRTDCIGRIKDSKKYDSVKQQLDKSNNILTELEEYIGQEWYCFDNESIEFEVAKDILNKIQELKEKYK